MNSSLDPSLSSFVSKLRSLNLSDKPNRLYNELKKASANSYNNSESELLNISKLFAITKL